MTPRPRIFVGSLALLGAEWMTIYQIFPINYEASPDSLLQCPRPMQTFADLRRLMQPYGNLASYSSKGAQNTEWHSFPTKP